MDPEDLYKIYAGWSRDLHQWCAKELGVHVDAEFFPIEWKFKVYSGMANVEVSLFGVPHLTRPGGERSFVLKLATPDQDPTPEELAKTFRNICLATARILEIDLGVPKLGGQKKGSHGRTHRVLKAPDSPDEPTRPSLLPRRSKPPGIDRTGSEGEDPPPGKD